MFILLAFMVICHFCYGFIRFGIKNIKVSYYFLFLLKREIREARGYWRDIKKAGGLCCYRCFLRRVSYNTDYRTVDFRYNFLLRNRKFYIPLCVMVYRGESVHEKDRFAPRRRGA